MAVCTVSAQSCQLCLCIRNNRKGSTGQEDVTLQHACQENLAVAEKARAVKKLKGPWRPANDRHAPSHKHR